MPILQQMWDAFLQIARAPFLDLSVLWLLAPILVFWIVLEIYLDKHKDEKLGWNTALGNGLSMFWVVVTAMRHIFQEGIELNWIKLLAISLILAYALFIIIISFTHRFRDKIVFPLASPTPVYFMSGIAILWAFDSLAITWWILLDLVILFLLIGGIEHLIRMNMPAGGEGESLDDDLGFSERQRLDHP